MFVVTRRALLLALLVLPTVAQAATSCDVNAEVVALNQPFTLNRLGAWVPQGMVYALKRDVVPDDCYNGGGDCTASGAPLTLQPGKVQMRRERRPRPLVLRVNQGQCLNIKLWNMLPTNPTPYPCPPGVPSATCQPPNSPATRGLSVHVQGLELAATINDDGSYVGKNDYGLANPGQAMTYQLLAAQEGTFLMYSMGANFDQATVGGTAMGTATNGMFGSVTVQPKGAEYYRSQITNEDLLKYATRKDSSGNPVFTPLGQPQLAYQARYPVGHPRACAPVVRMVAAPQQVVAGQCQPVAGAMAETYYGDLTAIITGPNTGNFTGDSPSFDPITASPQRRQPYREFSIHYHELFNPTQAFNAFNSQPECNQPAGSNAGMNGVLTPGSDLFAINYGTGGIAAEILANRYKVGPMKDCVDCKFEEFFLSAWSVGDPAMVTDVPANKELGGGTCTQEFPTKALFPDDPSNVYHSYLNDHVKFRILHAGANLTHVHHQHAHQWLHTPNDNDSTYLDSQMISPGSAYTLEIDYHGSGNRNRTIGDMIFHCHFYPHFAAGMWSMWRVHDVFEGGTELEANGVPKQFARALPDGELGRGAPIPAIVPIPTLVMPPLPSYTTLNVAPAQTAGRKAVFGGTCQGNAVNGIPVVGGCTNGQILNGTARLDNKFVKSTDLKNPGFPFFIPGLGGSRPPHPPLDFPCDEVSPGVCKMANGKPVLLDGGLPRHLVEAGTVSREQHNVWDFTKDNDTLDAVELPEDGTPEEKAAIEYNKIYAHPSFTPRGVAGVFHTNGLPRGPQHGAPFADPAVFMDGSKAGERVIRYKAADVQTDVVFNKRGWHYPQQRFITLWEDAQKAIGNTGDNQPQPFFFRANSEQDIIEYWLANMVPAYYELDDFQVRTPTDILGQHIHLVKFDVLASDGAANGYNYEDGTLSYQEVDERIHAINKVCAPAGNCGLRQYGSTTRSPLTAKTIPELDPDGKFMGLQATVQRWYPDRLLGDKGDPTKDRTLRTVFTHDHFGPSTHQQAGLYAGLLVEPKNSKWTLQDGTPMMTRKDGGPTSWEARILHGNESYREFALEFQDLALSYSAASIGKPVCYPGTTNVPVGCNPVGAQPTYPTTITPTTPVFGWADQSHSINPSNAQNGNLTNPTIISGGVFTGTLTVNYRNEPLALRVNNKAPNTPDPTHDPANPQTDLAFAFASIPRWDTLLNRQPAAGTPIDDSIPARNDFKFSKPFEGAGPYDPYTPLLRAYQDDKIQVRVLVGGYLFNHNFAFHGVKWRFEPSALDSGWRDNQGMGISEHFEFLFKAPVTQNAAGTRQPCASNAGPKIFCADYLYMPGAGQWDLAQGLWGLMRTYNLNGGTAIPGLRTLPNNTGGGAGKKAVACPTNAPKRQYYVTAKNEKPIFFDARISVGNSIVNPYPLRFVLTDQNGVELSADKTPLVLRANAGDCVTVTLKNDFSTLVPIFTLRDANIPGFQPLGEKSTSGFYASAQAGLHPQLLSYDITKDAGMNIGLNPTQTVGPGQSRTYTWYAGNVEGGVGTAIEFGSSNIVPADVIEQPSLSMVGAFVTEPQGSTWPADGRLTADVKSGSTTLFREFVNVLANNVYLYPNNALPHGNKNVPQNVAKFFNAINYSTNSMAYRFFGQTGTNPTNSNTISDAFSNTHRVPTAAAGTEWGDPQPVWVIERNKPFRLRMVHGDGIGGFPDDVIKVHGHVYPEEPYRSGSRLIGSNRKTNWMGAREGFGPGNQFDIVIDSAGGARGIPGDYLLASFPAAEQANGNWGLVRVCDPAQLQLFPCTPSAARALEVVPTEQVIKGERHDYPPAATGNERFLLRTDPETKPDEKPEIHVPANTGTPKPPVTGGGSGQQD
jgi:manganese oxidase